MASPASNVVDFANMLLAKHEANMEQREKEIATEYIPTSNGKLSIEPSSSTSVQIIGQSTESNQEAFIVTTNPYKREVKRVNEEIKEAKNQFKNNPYCDGDESPSRRSALMAPVEELSESLENMHSAREKQKEQPQYEHYIDPMEKYKQYSPDNYQDNEESYKESPSISPDQQNNSQEEQEEAYTS